MRAMRLQATSALVLLATMTVSACGGAGSATGSRTGGASSVATARATAPPTTTAAAATTYDTHLERAVALAFGRAYLATPVAPTQSQIPPRIVLLLRDPPTVCQRLRPGAYRCSLTYQLPSGPPVRVIYGVARRHGCFTATASTIAPGSALHRLRNC